VRDWKTFNTSFDKDTKQKQNRLLNKVTCLSVILLEWLGNRKGYILERFLGRILTSPVVILTGLNIEKLTGLFFKHKLTQYSPA
jgi:hypothetical protein